MSTTEWRTGNGFDTARKPPRPRWSGAAVPWGVCAAALIGLTIPIVAATLGDNYALVALIASGVGLPILIVATVRWPFLPLIIYWFLYSFISVFQVSTWRVLVNGVPVTIADGIALIMAAAALVMWLRRNRSIPRAASWLSVSLAILLAYAFLAAGLGASHGFSFYAIGIDLRAVGYIAIGFVAARLTLRADQHERLLVGLFLVGLIGLIIEQTVVTVQEFARLPGLTGSISNLRDIGAPFYLGKYGLLLLLLLPVRRTDQLVTVIASVVVGMAAVVVTFIRTSWLEVAVGIAAVAVFGGWRATRRIALVSASGLFVAVISLALLPQVGVLAQAAQDRLDQLAVAASPNLDTVASRLAESEIALANLHDPQDWVFGVGLGLSVHDGLHPNQHNSFVWALSKEGIVGLAMFAGVIVLAPLFIGVRAIPHVTGLRRVLLVVLLAGHVANVAGGFSSGTITFSAYTPLLGMSLAWIADLANAARRQEAAAKPLERRPA